MNRPVIVTFGVCCEKSPRRWSIQTVGFIQRTANDLYEILYTWRKCLDYQPSFAVELTRKSLQHNHLKKESNFVCVAQKFATQSRFEPSGFVLCISVSCASGPKIIVPESVIGRWRGVESGSLLEFTETGIFVVESKDGITLLGRCNFQGTRVTLRYQLGAAVCPEEPGQYTLEVEGSNMRTADPSDSCFDRRTMMAQAWMREAR